jgi:lipid II:glycine glycyltransferase (peptidoglycan interpeptide bridge formation enzyme)
VSAAELTRDAQSWDAALGASSGHLLQSWRWGAFKSLHGWTVERVAVQRAGQIAQAQVLIRKRGPFGLAYVPRGPAFSAPDPELSVALFGALDSACRRHGVAHLILEPDSALPLSGTFKQAGFVRGPEHFQPSRTVKVPLSSDDELLAQMHQKTRYSVRLAERRGVTYGRAGQGDPEPLERFYTLLRDTSSRNAFGIHSLDYYADFMEIFGQDALLVIATADGHDAAGLIAARFGSDAIYMYGGSSTENRAHGAAFGLQFDAMRWARSLGSQQYDLWGIPKEDPVTRHEDGDKVAGSRGDDWRGLYKFKTGFGGKIVCYPPTIERRYRPLISLLARQVYARRAV